MTTKKTPKIGIIGGGFAGVDLLLHLYKRITSPCTIFLFEKTGVYGAGDAYRTDFAHHLLNVRAKDMSAYEDDPHHFVSWLNEHKDLPVPLNGPSIKDAFVPRLLYRHYLNTLLQALPQTNSHLHLKLYPEEVCAMTHDALGLKITHTTGTSIVDVAILATGNSPPMQYPFEVNNTHNIVNPWCYHDVAMIPSKDPVLIVGTGLSMIDAVLTLYHQQHQATIYAVSRRGLCPLPHSDLPHATLNLGAPPKRLRALIRWVRDASQKIMTEGSEWQALMQNLRPRVADLWADMSIKDKKTFLRHVLPYWNVHRHRVPRHVASVLEILKKRQQLHLLSGRVIAVNNNMATVKYRNGIHQDIAVRTLINCIGPQSCYEDRLYQNLLTNDMAKRDPVNLGFLVDNQGAIIAPQAKNLYALGALRKGMLFEVTAVPEIRLQCQRLAEHLVLKLAL